MGTSTRHGGPLDLIYVRAVHVHEVFRRFRYRIVLRCDVWLCLGRVEIIARFLATTRIIDAF
jgi:hypothetical protein